MSTLTQQVIDRNAQITAIKAKCLDYKHITSVTTTPTHVIVVVIDPDEAISLYDALRHDNWIDVTIRAGQYSNIHLIRIPVLMK